MAQADTHSDVHVDPSGHARSAAGLPHTQHVHQAGLAHRCHGIGNEGIRKVTDRRSRAQESVWRTTRRCILADNQFLQNDFRWTAQVDGEKTRQADTQTDTQTDTQIGRQVGKQADRQADRHAGR